MFGFGTSPDKRSLVGVSKRLCTTFFDGSYSHVGLYDCVEKKIWICKPLNGQAIRTSHARLITGSSENKIGTVWKDRFICHWFFTPSTGEGYIHGYPIDWEEAHLLIRIDPNWDYDRQRLIPPEFNDQTDDNVARQFRVGHLVKNFYQLCKLSYPFSLHFVGQRATDSQFYVKRIEPGGPTPDEEI